jgi:hypothetical protein
LKGKWVSTGTFLPQNYQGFNALIAALKFDFPRTPASGAIERLLDSSTLPFQL